MGGGVPGFSPKLPAQQLIRAHTQSARQVDGGGRLPAMLCEPQVTAY